jgi:hypothetical protein
LLGGGHSEFESNTFPDRQNISIEWGTELDTENR